MAEQSLARKFSRRAGTGDTVDAGHILNALSDVVLVLDAGDRIRFANEAAEPFFRTGVAQMTGRPLQEYVPADHPLFSLIEQVRLRGGTAADHALRLSSPRIGDHDVSVRVSAMGDEPSFVTLAVHEHSFAQQIDRRLVHRSAARSLTAMAAVLAHEVKNPLSGIRGAAQLLESEVGDGGRELTRLICDEADRICALVDRMEMFGDRKPPRRGPVNIHEILDHVRKLAESGFARRVRISFVYDPSLPPTWGDRDQLVQVFLNLVKNAAEAAPAEGGEITLTTSYRHGFSVGAAGSSARRALPLVVQVQDNGAGIPDELAASLFDPFVTTKSSGSGLGLALSAKIIDEHGGLIECESQPRRTVFRVMLPVDDTSPGGRGMSVVSGALS